MNVNDWYTWRSITTSVTIQPSSGWRGTTDAYISVTVTIVHESLYSECNKTKLLFVLFLLFFPFMTRKDVKHKKGNFNQQRALETPIGWSKYTTANSSTSKTHYALCTFTTLFNKNFVLQSGTNHIEEENSFFTSVPVNNKLYHYYIA